MCKSTLEAGGPRRCSSDARGALANSTATVSALESRREVAESALAAKAPPAAAAPTGLRKAVPRCFFCDDLTTDAAHMTRYGKICCHRCWPDVRLTQGHGGGTLAVRVGVVPTVVAAGFALGAGVDIAAVLRILDHRIAATRARCFTSRLIECPSHQFHGHIGDRVDGGAYNVGVLPRL